jgi:glycine cleavage system aminomethyltransferase T
VPDLVRAGVGVIVCLASSEALERLIAPGYGAIEVRTAPDEVRFICDAEATPDVEREVRDRIAALEPDAMVHDATDGWVAWSVRGADARDAFAAVSPLEAPAAGAWTLGDVARVPATVLGGTSGLTVMVAAYHDDHLRDRLAHDAGGTLA